MSLLGSLQFEPLPQLASFLSLPQTQSPPFFFSQDSFPERSRHQNGGRGIGPGGVRKVSQTGFAPAPPAPTWAYPRCLLLLLILATSAPPRRLVPQTCKGARWEQGAAAARRSAPSRPHAPGPFPAPRPRQPLPPRVLRPHPQPLTSPPRSRVHHCPAGTQE